jgi:hypothetical protein
MSELSVSLASINDEIYKTCFHKSNHTNMARKCDPCILALEDHINANKIKIAKSIANQAQVISELEEEILTGAKDLVEGFFYKSNKSGFEIAKLISNKKSNEINSIELDELNLTWSDLMVIIGGYDSDFMKNNPGYKSKYIKNLADFDLSLRSILEDIRSYDSLANN